jgi:hypothetical protein
MSELEDLKHRVQRLEDAEAIRRLRATYSRGCDDKNNLDILMPLFTDDAWIKLNPPFNGFYQGKDALAEMYRNNAEVNGVGWTVHYYLQPEIDISEDGLTAKANWYLWEPAMMRLENPEQEAVLMAGSYDDTYRKEDGIWKISSIEINMLMLARYKDGWEKERVFGVPN